MFSSRNKIELTRIFKNLLFSLFILIVFVYALLFLIKPQLGPTDDFVFLRTLQAGRPLVYASQNFPYYDWLGLGRFHPLVSWEYNLVGLFSTQPFWYFFYHALQFILFIILLLKLLKQFSPDEKLAFLIILILIFLPAFTISWFRLQLPERNALFFFTAFLLTYLAYLKEQRWFYFILALVLANIAIYYKEAAFIAVGAFAFFHLVLSWRRGRPRARRLDLLLGASSIFYLSLYYLNVYQYSQPFIFRHPAERSFLVFLKNIFNYSFFSDPILFLLLMPLAGWRFYRISAKKDKPDALTDSLTAAAAVYVLGFLVLNLFQPYYLLPAYAFGLPALLYFFNQTGKLNLGKKLWLGLVCFLFLTNTLPAGLYFLTYNKYLPVNFNQALDFLIEKIRSAPAGQKTIIFLDGVDLATGRGTYFILAEFLHFRGAPFDKFDLKSNTPTARPEPVFSKIQFPFTIFNQDTPSTIQSGDYLIVTPQSSKNITREYLNSLKQDYDLVFQTKSPLTFPNINLKTLVKYLLTQYSNVDTGNLVKNQNLSILPDYYVFVKR